MTKIQLVSKKEHILVEDTYFDLFVLVNKAKFFEVTQVVHYMGGRKETSKVVINTSDISYFLEVE
jgi:hypothetical protein